MKKILYLSVVVTAIAVISSCDYVADPHPAVNANSADTASCPTPTFPSVTTHIKKVLIEDYTAHTCPNCPRAARQLHAIDSTYPGHIIGIGIHVGSLAAPAPTHGPAGSYLSDFRTTVGTTYDAVFGAGDFGLPEGLINRKNFDAGMDHLKPDSNWPSFVASIISEPSVVDLQIMNDYNSSTKKLCCSLKSTFLSPVSGTYKLVALLVQDSIVDWQDDGTTHIQFYTNRHMLRDAINPSGAWGEALASGSITTGTTNTQRYAYTIPVQYNSIPCDVNQCSIIAFIYNTATYEIIQSEEVKVTP